MSYWDTSCLLKVYTPESDSLLFRNHLRTSPRCVTSDITPLEFWSTVRRKESEGILAPGEAAKVQAALDGDLSAGLIRVVTEVVPPDQTEARRRRSMMATPRPTSVTGSAMISSTPRRSAWRRA